MAAALDRFGFNHAHSKTCVRQSVKVFRLNGKNKKAGRDPSECCG
jgi:hypothetical protein